MAVEPTSARRGDLRLVRIQGMPPQRWFRTTPGRFRLWSVVLVIGVLVVGIVAGTAAKARGDAARSVGSVAAPELVAAEGLYGSLADADATASIVFLKAGRESPVLRRRYEADIRAAGQQLATVASQSGTSPAERAAIRAISRQLPLYTGYVETARTNSRLGYPVGAAYLRQASTLMRGTLLPSATKVYESAATRLADAYRSGTSTNEIVFVLVAGGVVLGLLICAQFFVFGRSRRIVNLGILAGTVIVVGLIAWPTIRFASAQSSLVSAQREGSDAVQLLSAGRILLLQAQADENTTLIERGGGGAFAADFESVMKRLGGRDGRGALLAEARAVAARTGSQARIDAIEQQVGELQTLHRQIRAQDDNGDYENAVTAATGPEAEVVSKIDSAIDGEIAAARDRLDSRAADARGGFGALAVVIPILVLLAGGLVLFGFQRRISEYR